MKLSYPELVELASKILAKDRERLAGLPYPAYNGKQVSEMSSMTQKARDYGNTFATKAAPFTNKINKIQNRTTGLDAQKQNDLLSQILLQPQQKFNQNIAQKQKEQFGVPYDPRTLRFENKSTKDLNLGLLEPKAQIRDLGKTFNNVDQSNNNKIIDLYNFLGQRKQDRRSELINKLQQYGNQKHAYNNMQIEGDKLAFEEQANRPFKNAELLSQVLSNHAGQDPSHPDVANSKAQELLQALRAYGIDTSKSPENWENSRMQKNTYPGRRVADLNPYLKTSWNVLEQMGPKTRDAYYAQTKAPIKELLNEGNISDQVLRSLPADIQEQIQGMEKQALARHKKDLSRFSNKYASLGQYGTGAHMKSTEDSARELQDAVLKERNSILRNYLKSNINQTQDASGNKIKNIYQNSISGNRDYNDVMSNVDRFNKTGQEILNNDQDEQEQIYKNYYNQDQWMWPHLRNDIRRNALGEVFSSAANKGMGIGEIARNNTRFSEIEKELDQLRNRFKTTEEARQGLLNQLGEQQRLHQSQLAERQRQQQLVQQQQAQEQAKLAEQQRLAALQKQGQSSKIDVARNVIRKLMQTDPFFYKHVFNGNDLMRQQLGLEPGRSDDQIIKDAIDYSYKWLDYTNNGYPDQKVDPRGVANHIRWWAEDIGKLAPQLDPKLYEHSKQVLQSAKQKHLK